MASEKDLLFPAFQKFYSALSSLERFRKENSFFDNISSLDTFFSEFRNVTFVLQKSLAHTKYMPLYEQLRSKHLASLKWFVETRNQTTKEHPFELVKRIGITAYMPWRSFEIIEKQYTITNDKPLSSIIDESKAFLNQIHPVEVFFSARFSFYKSGAKDDLFSKISQGLRSMCEFLNHLYDGISEKSSLTEEVIERIKKSPILSLPPDMRWVNDYVYYPSVEKFENVERWGLSVNFPSNGKTISRTSMQNWRHWYHELGENDFDRFVAMHVAMRSREDIMPAFMTLFHDDTYEIDAFNASNKTTLYRKIHETAQQVLEDNVREVFFEYSLLTIADVPGVLSMTSKDRQKFATEEWLVLLKIDNDLNEEEYRFYVPGLRCSGYIRQQFNAGSDKKLLWGKANMLPIIEAFKKKKAMDQNSVGSAQQ